MKRILSVVVVTVLLGVSVVLAQTAGNVIDAEPILSIPREVPTFQNLIRNGSFESALNGTSPDGWNISQGVTLIDLDDTDRKAGHFSLLLKGPAILTQSIDALEELQGTKVVFGVWVKATQAGEVSLILDDGKSVQSVVNTLAGEWEFLTKKVSVSGQATKVDMAVNISLAHDVLIDGVVLSQLTKSVVFTPNPSDDIKMPSSLIYTDLETGKVGIGTSTPQKELDVAGDIRASGKVYQGESEQQEEVLTKTVADDLYLNDDQDETLTKNLTVNGLLTSGSGKVLNDLEVTGLVKAARFEGDGSGLTNILSQWKSSTDGTGIYFDQGNVGIGTTAPNDKLEVSGSSEPLIRITNTGMAGNPYLRFGMNAGNNAAIFEATTGKDFKFSNGQYALTILGSNGNVGIGTTNPIGKVHIASLQSTNPENLVIDGYVENGANRTNSTYIRQKFDTNPDYGSYWKSVRGANGATYEGALGIRAAGSDTEVITWRNDGNVGIGTTSPGLKFQVNTAGVTADETQARFINPHQGNTYSNIELGFNTNDGQSSPIGRIRTFSTDGNPGTQSGRMYLQTMLTGIWQDGVTILENGSVGIGTTNPGAKLTLANSNNPDLTFVAIGIHGSQPVGRIYGGYDSGGWADDYLRFQSTDSTGGSLVDTITLENGNVGIGTTNPTEKLDVNGNMKLGDNSALIIGNFGHKIRREPSDGSLYIGGGQANIIFQNNVGIGTTSPSSEIRFGDPNGFYTSLGYDSLQKRFSLFGSDNDINFIIPNGRLGISNSNPQYTLDVGGDVKGNRLCIGIDCRTAWPDSGGGVENVWSQSGSDIYYNSGNVAIGTTSSSGYPLFVNGTAKFSGGVFASNGFGIYSSDGTTRGTITADSTGLSLAGATANKVKVSGDLEVAGKIISAGEICIGKCN